VTIPLERGEPISALSCVSSTLGGAVAAGQLFFSTKGGVASTWKVIPQAPAGVGLEAFSCSLAGGCAAAESDGTVLVSVVPVRQASWRVRIAPKGDGGAFSVACLVSGPCLAVSPSGTTELLPGTGQLELTGVPIGSDHSIVSAACGTSFCAALDADGQVFRAALSADRPGRWVAISARLPSDLDGTGQLDCGRAVCVASEPHALLEAPVTAARASWHERLVDSRNAIDTPHLLLAHPLPGRGHLRAHLHRPEPGQCPSGLDRCRGRPRWVDHPRSLLVGAVVYRN
jgi:hypothetical protein